MRMPGDEKKTHDIHLEIMRENIKRDTIGRTLTPEAQEQAAQFAVANWPSNMGNGDAAKLGIKHVTKGVLK